MIPVFPQLSQKVYGKPLVYLDNAATSLRPQCVIDKWVEMSAVKNANLHRALHKIAGDATEEYENARKCVADFIGSESPSQVVFTSGTTGSLNLLAFSFGESYVGKGDEIIVAESEHHSDIVPWQMVCERKGASIKVLPVDDNGCLCVDMLPSLLSSKTRIACVAHVSNVLGIINPVERIVEICHLQGIPVVVDGAQAIAHLDVDVKSLGCDFYVFSGHKMYAAPGTGVLYGSGDWFDRLPPYMGGGEMIQTVNWKGTSYAEAPAKFEAGTQNISGVPTFVPAVDTVMQLRQKNGEMAAIRNFLLKELPEIDKLRLFGVPSDPEQKIPLFSFTIDGVHHEDLALILDKMGIAVRSGQMCAEPLMDRFGVTGMLRASFAPYNTMGEAEYFVDSLRKAVAMLK